MPLFLKNIAPELDIFGNRQLFNFNKDPSSGESDSALTLMNWFTPITNVNANSTLEFLTPALKGFRLNHSLSTTGTFGNFSFQKYDRFGTSADIFKFDEVTDILNFLKPITISGVPVASTNYVNTRVIDSQLNTVIPRTNSQAFNFSSAQSALDLVILTNSGGVGTKLRMGRTGGQYPITGFEFESTVANWGANIFNFNQSGTNATFNIFSIIDSTPQITFNNYRISGLLDPTSSTDAATKSYVDSHSVSTFGVAVNNMNANGYTWNNLSNPVSNQDAATKSYVDTVVTKSILHGYNATTYSTNVASGDHIKFDSSVFTRGTAITLDTSSTYSNATNTASIGRITLAAGKTYKLTGSINNVVSANYNGMRWYNSDTGAALGVQSGMSSPISTTDRVPSAGFVAYITTSVSTRVELRITWNALSSVNGTADGIGPAWFIVEEV